MLTIFKTEEGYIKVIEKLHSWTKTEVRTVLYDLHKKKSKVNDNPWYDMTESSIAWVNKYYADITFEGGDNDLLVFENNGTIHKSVSSQIYKVNNHE